MAIWPDCFPADFEENILPRDVEYKCVEAYRLARWGKCEPRAFYSSYEESQREPRNKNDLTRFVDNLRKPGTYSTCLQSTWEGVKALKAKVKSFRNLVVLIGETMIECGPILIAPDGHIDWWIYKDSHPERFFKEMDNT